MKALSVTERAGTLIASGQKTLEIRRWRPHSLPLLGLAIVQNKRRLSQENPIDPDGRVIAIVDVLKVREWESSDAEAACSAWEAGWLAWELSNIRPVSNGPKVPAKRRIYDLQDLDQNA